MAPAAATRQKHRLPGNGPKTFKRCTDLCRPSSCQQPLMTWLSFNFLLMSDLGTFGSGNCLLACSHGQQFRLHGSVRKNFIQVAAKGSHR